LSDENIPAGKRQAIVEDLFGAKTTTSTTVQLCRWSSARWLN
jgi:hypothetical protein